MHTHTCIYIRTRKSLREKEREESRMSEGEGVTKRERERERERNVSTRGRSPTCRGVSDTSRRGSTIFVLSLSFSPLSLSLFIASWRLWYWNGAMTSRWECLSRFIVVIHARSPLNNSDLHRVRACILYTRWCIRVCGRRFISDSTKQKRADEEKKKLIAIVKAACILYYIYIHSQAREIHVYIIDHTRGNLIARFSLSLSCAICTSIPRKNLIYGQHIGNILDIGMGNIWGIYWETISNISAI